jgi:hypothetical protein
MFYSASVANGASFEKEIDVPAGLVSLKVMMAYSVWLPRCNKYPSE